KVPLASGPASGRPPRADPARAVEDPAGSENPGRWWHNGPPEVVGRSMPAQLFLHQLQLGPMQNFVYLVGTEGERDVVVVDPAWDVDAIEKTCAVHTKRLSGILLTHSHKDHTNGVAEIRPLRGSPPSRPPVRNEPPQR